MSESTKQIRNTFALWPQARRAWLWLLLGCVGAVNAQTVQFRQTSVPIGIVDQTSNPTVGATVFTVSAPEVSGIYRLAYWTLNGAIAVDAFNAAPNPAGFSITTATDAVAIYYPATQDSDGDGLPDWWEMRYFTDLDETPTGNPDGDTFDNATEYANGQSPIVFNAIYVPPPSEYADGGISRRRTPTLIVIEDLATYAILSESSTPQGAVLSRRVVTKGVPVALTNPPASTSGYQFTGWLLNGTRYDQPTDIQPITITPNADISFVARYTLATEDTDGDGLLDWKEWLWFESLQYDLTSDPDGDGFTNAEEQARSFSALAPDELATGGISRRRSPSIYVDTTGRISYRTVSNPATILNDQQFLPAGTAISVPDRNGHVFSGYKFCWWDMNGVRQQDASGVALTTFNFALNTATTLTGHYLDPALDSVGDGVTDWTKTLYYGSLTNGATSDTDGDGLNFAEELKRGYSPRAVDSLEDGGISRRRSPTIFVDTTGRISYRTVSDPATILSDQQFLPAGTVVTVPDRNGHVFSGYKFCWWDMNGVRQQDASGVALTTFTFPLNAATTLTGHYLDPALDSVGDGVTDWTKILYYGSLTNGATSDTDGDGFDFAEELKRGYSPRVTDTLIHGGLSRRRSVMVTINPVLDPMPPEVGALFSGNVGTTTAQISALVNPMSVATTANFEYGPTASYGLQKPSASILNGFQAAPMSAALDNLMPDTLYHFRVVATNALGVRTSEDGTFRTLPSYTGFENWRRIYGVGSPLTDYDGDGVPNLLEYAFGLNPRSPVDGPSLALYAVIEMVDGRFVLRCNQPLTVTGVNFGAQYTTDLSTWIDLPDLGIAPSHYFITPAELVGTSGLFVRWHVVLP